MRLTGVGYADFPSCRFARKRLSLDERRSIYTLDECGGVVLSGSEKAKSVRRTHHALSTRFGRVQEPGNVP